MQPWNQNSSLYDRYPQKNSENKTIPAVNLPSLFNIKVVDQKLSEIDKLKEFIPFPLRHNIENGEGKLIKGMEIEAFPSLFMINKEQLKKSIQIFSAKICFKINLKAKTFFLIGVEEKSYMSYIVEGISLKEDQKKDTEYFIQEAFKIIRNLEKYNLKISFIPVVSPVDQPDDSDRYVIDIELTVTNFEDFKYICNNQDYQQIFVNTFIIKVRYRNSEATISLFHKKVREIEKRSYLLQHFGDGTLKSYSFFILNVRDSIDLQDMQEIQQQIKRMNFYIEIQQVTQVLKVLIQPSQKQVQALKKVLKETKDVHFGMGQWRFKSLKEAISCCVELEKNNRHGWISLFLRDAN